MGCFPDPETMDWKKDWICKKENFETPLQGDMAMLPLVLPQKDLCLFTGITTLGKGVYTDTLQTGHKVQVDVDTQGRENH